VIERERIGFGDRVAMRLVQRDWHLGCGSSSTTWAPTPHVGFCGPPAATCVKRENGFFSPVSKNINCLGGRYTCTS